jgi:hypothetical protein
VLRKVQSNICPNPICKASFENLFVIYDKSKKPVRKYYGCPYCFFEIDPTKTLSLKKNNNTQVNEPHCFDRLEEVKISNCPKYFGYLADYFSNSIIPIECLDCKKMAGCMKKC